MTSRIESAFAKVKQQSRSALVTYITAGDPSPTASLPYMQALVDAGADVIELGMPFSDPMADGPVIQRASERALAAGMSLAKVLETVEGFRQHDSETPVVLMGYLNPIESMGYAEFAERASSAGVDGVLIVDSPPEESHDLNAILRRYNLDQIFLVSPNSSERRIKAVSDLGSGFVYYVSVKGVTGSATLDVAEVAERVSHFRSDVDLPIGVGFGVKTGEDAAAVAGVSDAVIIGSAIVEVVEQAGDNFALGCDSLRAKVTTYSEAVAQA